MRSVNLRDAKTRLSALVDAAQHGESVTITKHGKPAAVIVPLALAEKWMSKKPNFADFLMSFPGEGVEFERNTSAGRDFEF